MVFVKKVNFTFAYRIYKISIKFDPIFFANRQRFIKIIIYKRSAFAMVKNLSFIFHTYGIITLAFCNVIMPFAVIEQISQKCIAICSIIRILIFYRNGFIIAGATRSKAA